MVKKTPQIEIIQENRIGKIANIKKAASRNKTNISYAIAFFAILAVAIIGSSSNVEDEIQVNNISEIESTNIVRDSSDNSVSVDRVTETNVVANLAETANLAIAPNTASLSVSVSVMQDSKIQSPTVTDLEKPKILEVSSENREISSYKTTEEESIQQIADKFGITSQTIKWVNSLKGDKVEAGKELKILPVDGIIYKAKSGDKLAEIAEKYQASSERIISYNNLKESEELKDGQEIVIPGGILPEKERPDYVAPVVARTVNTASRSSSNSASSVATVLPSNYNVKAGNAYAWGNCTWYVYNRRPDIGSFWGNATSWAMSARAAGFSVGSTPVVGSIAQWNAYAGGSWGYGHVAYVEAVNSDGTVTISEMNYAGALGRVTSRTVPANSISNYIY